MATTTSNVSVIQLFEGFRDELDNYNDSRERIIKASRDVTNLSKKIIFLLHRIVMEESGLDEQASARRAAQSGREKLREVQDIFASLKGILQGDRFWQHHKQVSPGVQEYIEALSFAHYLEHGKLIVFDDVQRSLCDPEGVPFFPLTISDYLLGISDLTGELMRLAISGITRRGGRQKANKICAFVRGCKADFERLAPYVRELAKKQVVTAQSLEKIEDAAYAIFVRSSEYDLPLEILDDIVVQSTSRFSMPVSSQSSSLHQHQYRLKGTRPGSRRVDVCDGDQDDDYY